MTLFRGSRLPSPPPADGDMPPRPQPPRAPLPGWRPRGAMIISGPRVLADDPTGSGPMAVAGTKSNGGRT